MFLCSTCHLKSTCRSEIHLKISRGKCDGCGYAADCFDCSPTAIIYRRSVYISGSIAAYRNVKRLQYRKINI